MSVKSLRSHEGYMLLDNRNTPGVDDATMTAMGYPVSAGRGLFEAATYTCSHCNAVVVLEPKRTRERGYCRKCAQRVCDACEVIRAKTFECHSMAQIIDEVLEATTRQNASTTILLP